MPEPQASVEARSTLAPSLAYLMLALAAVAWSSNMVLGRYVEGEISPVLLSFGRWFIALAVLLPFSFTQVRDALPAMKREWRYILLLGLSGMAIFHTTVYLALQSATAVNAILIMAMSPAMIPLLSRIIRKDSLRIRQMAGIAISLVGVAVIVTRADIATLTNIGFAWGDALMVMAMIFWSLYSVLAKRRPADIPPNAYLTGTILAALLCLAPVLALDLALWSDLPTTTEGAVKAGAVITYIAVVPSLLGFALFARGLEAVGPNVAGLFIHLMPVSGTILSILFLGEVLRPFHGIGIAFIAAGLFLTTRQPANRRSGY